MSSLLLEGIAEDGGVIASNGALLARATQLAEDTDRTLVSCDTRDLVSKGLAILPPSP